MIPVLQSELTYVYFSTQHSKYKDLLEAEYQYIKSNQDYILEEAKRLYDSVNKGHAFYCKLSCNFQLLESVYKELKTVEN